MGCRGRSGTLSSPPRLTPPPPLPPPKYHNIVGGGTREALHTLTGWPCEKYDLTLPVAANAEAAAAAAVAAAYDAAQGGGSASGGSEGTLDLDVLWVQVSEQRRLLDV